MGVDGKVEEFHVTAATGEKEGPWSYRVTKNGDPFAKLAVNWAPETDHADGDLIERAWIFEKLTGLAREHFPQRYGPENEDKPKLERLEDLATVVVEAAAGIEEARLRFSTTK